MSAQAVEDLPGSLPGLLARAHTLCLLGTLFSPQGKMSQKTRETDTVRDAEPKIC